MQLAVDTDYKVMKFIVNMEPYLPAINLRIFLRPRAVKVLITHLQAHLINLDIVIFTPGRLDIFRHQIRQILIPIFLIESPTFDITQTNQSLPGVFFPYIPMKNFQPNLSISTIDILQNQPIQITHTPKFPFQIFR